MDMTTLATWFSPIVTALVGGMALYKFQQYDADKKSDKEEALLTSKSIKVGMRCLLRNQIIVLHDKCKAAGNKISFVDSINLETAYQSYHDLGGNGTITQLYNEMKNYEILPQDHKE